jgi:hypothetical protein
MINWICCNSHVSTIDGLKAVPRGLLIGFKHNDHLVVIRCKTCGAVCKVDDFGDPIAKSV